MRPIIGIIFSENIEDDPSNNYIKAITEFDGIPRTLYPRHIRRRLRWY